MSTMSEPPNRVDRTLQEAIEEAKRKVAALSEDEKQRNQADLEARYRWAAEIVAGRRDPLDG